MIYFLVLYPIIGIALLIYEAAKDLGRIKLSDLFFLSLFGFFVGPILFIFLHKWNIPNPTLWEKK